MSHLRVSCSFLLLLGSALPYGRSYMVSVRTRTKQLHLRKINYPCLAIFIVHSGMCPYMNIHCQGLMQ